MPTKRRKIDLSKLPMVGKLLSPGFDEMDGIVLGGPPDSGAWMGR